MSLPRLVVCLSLLVPSLGFAQPPEQWTPYSPPATETTPPPPLVPAPTPPEAPPPPQVSKPRPQDELIPRDRLARSLPENKSGLRLIVSPWVGIISGMAGLIVGIAPTVLGSLPFCLGDNGFQEDRCGYALLTGMTLWYTMGVSLGITLINGGMLDGRGDGLATFLGGLAGAMAGAGIGLSTQSVPAYALGLIFGPLLGAVVTYEVSHALNTRPEEAGFQARSGFHVMPVVSTTPRGGFLGGLAVRF